MTRQEYIRRKISILKETMISFQRWSIVLFVVAVVSIIVSFIGTLDKLFSIEFLKYGLSSIATISGAGLQGVKYLRKNKLIELEYSEGIVSQYETLQEFDKKIVNNALDGIFNN